MFQSKNASCVPPHAYGRRFQDFVLIEVLKPIMKKDSLRIDKLTELVMEREIKEEIEKKATEKRNRGYKELLKILKKVGLGRSTIHKLTMGIKSRSKNNSSIDRGENELGVLPKRGKISKFKQNKSDREDNISSNSKNQSKSSKNKSSKKLLNVDRGRLN
jgi:hypothetical protein